MDTAKITDAPTGGKSYLKKQVQHMFANVAPDLFAKGSTTDSKATMEAAKSAMVASPDANDENKTELAEGSGGESAPFDLILGFMTASMSKDYQEALCTCKLILQYEPKNDLVRQFLPVLEQLNAMSSDEDDSSGSDNSDEDETSSSGSDDSTESISEDSESAEEDNNALEGGDPSGSESDSSDDSEDTTEGDTDSSHSSELGPDPFNTAFIEEPENVSDASEIMTVTDLVNNLKISNQIGSPASKPRGPGDF